MGLAAAGSGLLSRTPGSPAAVPRAVREPPHLSPEVAPENSPGRKPWDKRVLQGAP